MKAALLWQFFMMVVCGVWWRYLYLGPVRSERESWFSFGVVVIVGAISATTLIAMTA